MFLRLPQTLDDLKLTLSPELKKHIIPLEKISFKYPNLMSCIFAEGGFGFISAGKLDGQHIAVKFPLPDNGVNTSIKRMAYFIQEAERLNQLQSPYITKFLGFVYSNDYGPGIAMKRYAKSLNDFVIQNSNNITLEQQLKWALTISEGIAEIHEKGLIHNDIRAQNIFLDNDNNPVIADFGEACEASAPHQKLNEGHTCRYMPPEFLNDDFHPSQSSDIYSLGVLFWQMIGAKEKPFNNYKEDCVRDFKRKQQHEKIDDSFPAIFKELIKECWSNDPSKRPSAREIANRLQKVLNPQCLNVVKVDEHKEVKTTPIKPQEDHKPSKKIFHFEGIPQLNDLKNSDKIFHFESIAQLNDLKNLNKETLGKLLKKVCRSVENLEKYRQEINNETITSYPFWVIEVVNSEINPADWTYGDFLHISEKIKVEDISKVYLIRSCDGILQRCSEEEIAAHEKGISNPLFIAPAKSKPTTDFSLNDPKNHSLSFIHSGMGTKQDKPPMTTLPEQTNLTARMK